MFPASLQGDKGNKVLTMASKSHLKLADNPVSNAFTAHPGVGDSQSELEILEAYVISGEGMTKAAGFDVRVSTIAETIAAAQRHAGSGKHLG